MYVCGFCKSIKNNEEKNLFFDVQLLIFFSKSSFFSPGIKHLEFQFQSKTEPAI